MKHQSFISDLTRVASNYHWTWHPPTETLLDRVPGESRHPLTRVRALSDGEVEVLHADDDFVTGLARAVHTLESVDARSVSPIIAYLSPEFGLSAALPQYAGGLGILAGDHLKTASDQGLPLVGVGLFYGEGVFRQVVDNGEQAEAYHAIDPRDVGARDTGVVVTVPFPGRRVSARVWRIDVGRVPLLLLDTDIEDNSEHDRRITDRVYFGTRQHRVEQEMILGVGGARALAAMGWEIEVHHLNEGHAGFIVFELIDRLNDDVGFADALAKVREGLVFTTHTPVPEGIDCFGTEVIGPYLDVWSKKWDLPVHHIWDLGRDPIDHEIFNMAALCLRSSRTANGVSRLHGEVSRRLFAGIGIGDDIGYVTNGVHARTWTAPHIQELFDGALAPGWADGAPHSWQGVAGIDDSTLDGMRRRSSLALADLVTERTGATLDPDAMIVGFARRFAPYKRATLLLKRADILESILGDDQRPVHFVFAGKAHPSDANGKGLVAELIRASGADPLKGRITFVPDYEMDVARALVQGTDIWLNNPIRPREASGTSGEKAVLNGSLNCSILDGWWAEMFDGHNGWEIATSESEDEEIRDHEEATAMLETLAAIASEYHGCRPAFLGRVRHAWITLGPQVTSARMLDEYRTRVYRRE